MDGKAFFVGILVVAIGVAAGISLAAFVGSTMQNGGGPSY